MYIRLLLVTLILLALAFLLMAIRIILIKSGVFPNTSVGGNKNLRQMGIKCVRCEEQAKFNQIRKQKNKLKIDPSELRLLDS